MIEAHDLTRKFGDFTAVAGVSFALSEGEIVGILGPNGAGKTTTIRMLTGFLPPSSGRVTLGGRDLFGNAPDAVAVRRDLGYLPESVALYPEMRVEEYLSYRARLEGMDRPSTRRRLGEVLERCLLADVRRQVIGTLSKGYRQRVGLAGDLGADHEFVGADNALNGDFALDLLAEGGADLVLMGRIGELHVHERAAFEINSVARAAFDGEADEPSRDQN